MSAEYVVEVLVRGALVMAAFVAVIGGCVLWFICALSAVHGWGRSRREAALYHLVTWGPFVLFFGVAFAGPPA